ncbi:MAG: class I SAM-dependent methyltransferase [Gammaproteobacteria bacterium]|nr:class I SAM-dependent methyltransferase [Gammaproteobacteria bacterium]
MSRYLLQNSDIGLRLVDRFSRQHPLHISFSDAGFSYRLKRGGGKKEMIAKAVGVKPSLRVIDCTAGLGRDSFLLASLGCEVTMFERSKVMAFLLEDAINRAMANERLADTASRISLVHGDAIALLGRSRTPHVILIDPMFPIKKKSAQAKGEMQFLQRFIGKDEDASGLLRCAIATGSQRIVLKRPLSAIELDGFTPSFSLKGKSNRFDVFLQ